MKRSAIVLAGGHSNRFGQDKGLLELFGQPLVDHVLDGVSTVVDEVLLIVSSESQEKAYAHLKPRARVVVDKYKVQSPLVGALTGFENVHGEHSLLLPCDTPFISTRIATLLLELCVGKDAVIPRWPNTYTEPLQAAYCTESALNATHKALQDKRMSVHSVISYLEKVRYISTSALKQMDPQLTTFFNVNSPEDLRKAEGMLRHARNSVNSQKGDMPTPARDN